MDKFLGWWRVDKRYMVLLKAVLLALLPFLCCIVYCAAQGRTIGQVYLPGSEWNDELFYYKQVEGIVSFGYPQGYFGFNESHALKLSFAAWSPVLVFPWILWGLLFGWNLMSPIWCNLFLMTLCCFLFVWLVRPTWKQLGILAFLFCLYTPFVRYILSGMPEVICFAMLILFYGISINYLEREKNWKLVMLVIMSGIMTLMRPYLLLFLLLPLFFWMKKNRRKGAVGSLFVLAAVLGTYAGIKHYLGAEYFAPLFFTDWVTAFFEQGFFGGIRYTLAKLYYMGTDFLGHTLQGFRTGLASGAFFGGYLVMMAVLIIQSLRDFIGIRHRRREGAATPEDEDSKQRNMLIVEGHLAFCFVAMLFALLLMYKLTEGSKHLLTFMAAGLFIVALMETGFYKKAVLVGAVFAYLYTYKAVDPYDYQVPFVAQERQAQLEDWTGAFEELLTLSGKAPNFDNVVMWVFNDEIDEQRENLEWQLLYGLPKGFGISCCMPDYVIQNFGSLKCRYMATLSGGRIDGMCADAGYRELYRSGSLVLYMIWVN